MLEAIVGCVHVVAHKPFKPAVAAHELERAAADAGVLLTVFHDRRWDADVRTLAKALESGELGPLGLVHSRFDLDDPATHGRRLGPSSPGSRQLESAARARVVVVVLLIRSVRRRTRP